MRCAFLRSRAMSRARPTPIAAPTTHSSTTGGLAPAVSRSVTACAVRVEFPPPKSVVSVCRFHSFTVEGIGFGV
jgi:hypothetical protein